LFDRTPLLLERLDHSVHERLDRPRGFARHGESVPLLFVCEVPLRTDVIARAIRDSYAHFLVAGQLGSSEGLRSRTYTHVVADEGELDYAALLA
jgi:hypothetical protein